MRPPNFHRTTRATARGRRAALAAALAGVLVAGPALAQLAPPPPPRVLRTPPPGAPPAPPPPVYAALPPPQPVGPPPLPIAMRIVYAPFYVTGLVLRYGVYYLLVAPFEVLGRALDYGVDGGVDPYRNADSR